MIKGEKCRILKLLNSISYFDATEVASIFSKGFTVLEKAESKVHQIDQHLSFIDSTNDARLSAKIATQVKFDLIWSFL